MFLVISDKVVDERRSVDETLQGGVQIASVCRVHQATTHTTLLLPSQFYPVFVVQFTLHSPERLTLLANFGSFRMPPEYQPQYLNFWPNCQI